MRSYPITDEDGRPLGYGCGPGQPAPGDIAVVREFAETLRVPAPTPCPRCDGTRSGPLRWTKTGWGCDPCPACCCAVCGQATDTPPECQDCAIREDAAAVRRADR